MKILILSKSILLVFTIYGSFILNNSISSLFSMEIYLSSIILSFILTDLSISSYKFFFSNDPGKLFYLSCYFFELMVCVKFPFLIDNFVIFFGIFLSVYINSFLTRFSSFDEQLTIDMLSMSQNQSNYTIHENKGILFIENFINYSNNLGFMTQADKKIFFEFIKNNDGYIMFNNGVTINFLLKGKGIKFISPTKNNLIKDIDDIENLLLNLLIEK